MRMIDGQDEQARVARCHSAVTVFTDKDYDSCLTRQELAAEADINTLMRRYLPHELPAREVFYGERDYSVDFHDAMLASREGHMWYQAKAAADPLFARKFPSYGAFVSASPEVLEAYGIDSSAAAAPPSEVSAPPSDVAPERAR